MIAKQFLDAKKSPTTEKKIIMLKKGNLILLNRS